MIGILGMFCSVNNVADGRFCIGVTTFLLGLIFSPTESYTTENKGTSMPFEALQVLTWNSGSVR